MKKVLVFTSLFLALQANAQEENTKKEKDTLNAFNQWTVEAMVGNSKGIQSFGAGYFSDDPNNTFGAVQVNSYNLGVRYMIIPKFGVKLDFAYDRFTPNSSESLPFETNQFRIGLQGVVNAAKILEFKPQSRFGLLLHAGVQMSSFTSKTDVNYDANETRAGFVAGITPQYRIAPRIALLADLSMFSNFRQSLNWDGTYSDKVHNLYGSMANFSLGVSYSFGEDKMHGDWKQKQDPNQLKVAELQKKLDDIDVMMQDTDRDGVVDYLDAEPKTVGGVTVDTKGRAIDLNKNGVPDELEPSHKNAFDDSKGSAEEQFNNLVKMGAVNVFFDKNKETPNSGSANNMYYILNFLRKNPDAKIRVKGFADVTGDEKLNKELAQKRAQVVTEFLVYSGINANRIEVLGAGIDNTMGDKNKTGLQLSRRVSFELIN